MVAASSARLSGSAKSEGCKSLSAMRLCMVTPTKKGRANSAPSGRLAHTPRKRFQQRQRVLAGRKARLHPPAGVAQPAEMPLARLPASSARATCSRVSAYRMVTCIVRR